MDTDFRITFLPILFHFPLRAEKIYSAKLAESWLYHKNSLYAATVIVQYMNLDADDIILWFLCLEIIIYTTQLVTYFTLHPMIIDMAELCIFYILPSLLLTIQKLMNSLNVPGNV